MLFPFKESDVSQGLTSSILGEPGRFSLQYKYFSVSFLSASSWHWAREHSTSNSLICHSTHMNRSGWECQESAHFATETKIWGFFLLLCVCVGGCCCFVGFFCGWTIKLRMKFVSILSTSLSFLFAPWPIRVKAEQSYNSAVDL